ncbi:MAG: sigma 54-interacting transcriptional regulator [Gemmatimonadota bacterium]|nr:sigma 54-interacting transcriptional regulator [Gemmatimonadota bacterium]
MSELQAGTVVDGRYEILAAIGSGGLGTVYRARDVNDDATVALKMLNIVGDEAQRRFLREFNILSRIRHARIVRSHRWGLHAGKPYFSMDYIQGRPLSDLIASAEDLERLRTEWLLPLIRQIGEGLAYIHEQGVVHRDLKPSNIMIAEFEGELEVAILDLGLARFRESAEQRVTPPGRPTGTVEYMSPEQIRARRIDQRSDLYSLGVVLYEILTGRPPFTGENPASVMFQHLRDLPPPPRRSTGGVITPIEESVMKLLEKEPIDRYSSAGSLLYDLTDKEEAGSDQERGDDSHSPPHVEGTTDAPVLQPQFQGREREMKALREILRETGHGRGRVVLVSGVAGIGKSQVLEEFQADARVQGMRVLTGRCYENGGPPFGPFLEALRDIAEQPSIQESDLEASVRRVLTLIERPAPADQPEPYIAMETLSELLGDLSRETPTLVCIEDLQWADDLTLRFLDFMRRDPEPVPLVFGLACRKVDEDPLPPGIDELTRGPDATGVLHLQLEPLGMEETGNLAASLIGEQAVPHAEARRIFTETGGNPLFVVELIRGSTEEGLIWRDSACGWRWPESREWPMPSGIVQAIELRLGRLRSAQRQALEYASIFRGAFSFGLIAEVWREDELQLLETLEAHVRLGLLKDLQDREGRYRFSHGLIQRAVYDGISENRRSLLHQEAGRALEIRHQSGGSETLDELAYHFLRSNDLEKMVQYVTASGGIALRLFDFARALELFDAIPGKGAFTPGAPAGVSQGSLAHLNFLCAYAEALSGCDRYKDARRELDHVMRWVSADTPRQKAYALRMMGINHIHFEDYEKAESVLSEALGLFRELGDDESEMSVVGLLCNIYFGLKELETAEKFCESAAERCRELGGDVNEARALNYLAFAAQFTYRNERARTLLESSLDLMDRAGDRTHRHSSLLLLGRIEIRLGNLDRAKEVFQELRDFWARRGSKSTEALAHNRLGWIALEQGDTESAESHARSAGRLLSDGGRMDQMYRAYGLLAETLAATGRVEEALSWAERAWPGVKYGGNIRAIACTAKAKSLAAAGRDDEVDSLFDHVSEEQGPPDGLEQTNLFVVAGAYYLERRRLADARRYLEDASEAAELLNLRYLAGKAADLLERVAEEAAMTLPAKEMVTALSEEHLLTLYQASEDLTAVLDLNVLLDRILDRLKKVSRAERVLIALKDEDTVDVEVARRHNLDDVETHEISRGVIKWTMKRNEPVLSLDARVDERFRQRSSVTDYGIRSVLCVPLRHGESGVIGALYMDHRELEDLFTEKDRALLSAFGNLVSIAVVNARMYSRIQERALFLQQQAGDSYRLGELVGQSDVMQDVFRLVEVAAESDMTVLIQGETGTGKELAARAIHTRSERKAKPFLSANCAAMTHELLQSELFGHKKGAFTGASSDRKGLFVSADGGTVFLDEIGNASAQLQSSLLRVLQDGEIQRVGEAEVRNVDVRVIAATNRDLEADVRNGLFREDLYYRLRVLQIEMPPLRRHIEDIPLLCEHIVKRLCSDQQKAVPGFTVAAMRALMDHGWPGNVRELENEIRRAVALVEEGKEVSADLFSERIGLPEQLRSGEGSYFKSRVASLERRMIVEALDQCGRNISRAARQLGLSRNGLQKMMSRYGLR